MKSRISPATVSSGSFRRGGRSEPHGRRKESVQENRFVCSSCGQEHQGLPLSFAADYPDPYANLSPDDKDARAVASSDQCIIDQQQFYIRGCLEIPILGTDEVFLWGLWARINEEVFDEIDDHWESNGRENAIGPYKGRLANALSIYSDTLNQRVEIQIRPVGSRPLFILEEADNPLSIGQVPLAHNAKALFRRQGKVPEKSPSARESGI